MKWLGSTLMLLAVVLASCAMMAVEPAGDHAGEAGNADRYCTISGGFSERVCRYQLDEINEISVESAVQVQGYLFQDDYGFLHIISRPDGTGKRLRLEGVDDAGIERSRVEAMLGRLVRVRGIYTPEGGGIQVRTLGWIDAPESHGGASGQEPH